MRGESRSEIVVVEGTGDGCSSASRIEKAPDEKERLKAAELLGKRWSLFTDKVDVAGVGPVIIYGEDDIPD
ncbi:MAG: terminase small subunit, partial [Eubacterium sp.]